MAFFQGYRCDGPGCSNVRDASNGWFIGEKSSSEYITISAFTEEYAKTETAILLCGENCVQKFVSSNLLNLHERIAEKPNVG